VPGRPDPLAPYSILVLFPSNKTTNHILLARTHSHVVIRNRRVLIATKPA
jgi:hypothetical protein